MEICRGRYPAERKTSVMESVDIGPDGNRVPGKSALEFRFKTASEWLSSTIFLPRLLFRFAAPVPYYGLIEGSPDPTMAQDLDPFKLSSPRIFLVRMVVFLILCALVAVVLYKQILVAFLANPGLNTLIIGVLLIGIALAFRQVVRLFPEVNWVNSFRLADPGLAIERPPVLLAPMASILGDRIGRMTISSQTMRGILDSIAARLDEARDLSRYMTGLLIFLGLLGTFWGLIETVSSVGKVIEGLKVGGDAASIFDSLKEGLAAPLGGMGISFSSSLFGLAGSLVLGFLDLQTSQAQNRFYTDLEDWLSTTVRDLGTASEPGVPGGAPSKELRTAIDQLKDTIIDSGSNRAATAAMANLAEAIQGLVHHMRTEQQMIRDWVDSQAEQHREIRRLLEILVRENVHK